MRKLISVLAQWGMCIIGAVLVAFVCGFLTGTNFVAQCWSQWIAPASMWGDLVQNFPFFDNIILAKDVVDISFSGYNALFLDDKTLAIFADMYFVVLTALFLKPLSILLKNVARFLDRWCGGLGDELNGVCAVVCRLLIVYLATGLALVHRGIMLDFFKNNFTAAFFWMLAIYALLCLIEECIEAPKESLKRVFNSFVDSFGRGILDLLYIALVYVILILWDIERTMGLSVGYVLLVLICLSIFVIMTINHVVDTKRKQRKNSKRKIR